MMTSKINIFDIIQRHYKTLRKEVVSSDGQKKCYLPLGERFTFFLLPLVPAILSYWFNLKFDSALASILMNFGSIFTALSMSVLVLMYDQEGKLEQRRETEEPRMFNSKAKLLAESYHNISYAVLCSIFLVILCVSYEVADPCGRANLILLSIVVYIFTHLTLTLIMAVKRIHALLTSNPIKHQDVDY